MNTNHETEWTGPVEDAPDGALLFAADVPESFATQIADDLPRRVVVRRAKRATNGGVVVFGGGGGFLRHYDSAPGTKGRDFDGEDPIDAAHLNERGEYFNLGERAAVRLLIEERNRLRAEVERLRADVPSGGVLAIHRERQAHRTREGWTDAQDDRYTNKQLAAAALNYLWHYLYGSLIRLGGMAPWPWALSWFKPSSPRRCLEKAGALVAAEIDLLDRAAASDAAPGAGGAGNG